MVMGEILVNIFQGNMRDILSDSFPPCRNRAVCVKRGMLNVALVAVVFHPSMK